MEACLQLLNIFIQFFCIFWQFSSFFSHKKYDNIVQFAHHFGPDLLSFSSHSELWHALFIEFSAFLKAIPTYLGCASFLKLCKMNI